MERSQTYFAIPPGETIKEMLEDRSMSQKEFAVRMDLSEKHISKLVNGEVQLTSDVAGRLETVLGPPARFWSNLEATYREDLIKVRTENAMDADVVLSRQLPYNEMSKLGWVIETRKPKERVAHLRKFFEVVTLSSLESNVVTKIACRRLAVTEKGDAALMAWGQEAKRMAREIDIAPANLKRISSIIPEIRNMTSKQPEQFRERLQELLAGCGVALVFLPHLKRSFLEGATFMDGNRIVIGLTTRGRDDDKFWFSLFHEIGHIVLGHLKKPDGTTEQDETDADKWASEALIPSESYIEFKQNHDYALNRICAYAKAIGVAPGIVVGRLQNEKVLAHSEMNELKEHYDIVI